MTTSVDVDNPRELAAALVTDARDEGGFPEMQKGDIEQ
jgi:hypothetical protein